MKKLTLIILSPLIAIILNADLPYEIVDTGQTKFFGNTIEISEPAQGDTFYGQDAQFPGNQPDYTDNGDGTVTDNVTGLMWSKTCDTNGDGVIDVDDKMSYDEAMESISGVDIAGYDDWRIPTIKEQYSLIMFYGIDPSGFEGSTEDLVPFINTDYFGFGYGDESAGERIIDAQMITSNLYVADSEIMFGVNFADGRIKGYGTGPMPGQSEDKQFYIYYVRGNTEYGINDFEDNGDLTISDNATGLMWSQNDNGEGLNWEDALAWVEQKNTEDYLGYSDWRLPDIKELQSILDYTRSPDTSGSAAIDPLFNCTEITNAGGESDYPYYWSGTTHENWTQNNGGFASYVSFGRGLGWMEEPPFSGNYVLMDVHGAGCQRSDPKEGDPGNWPHGNGPQGDVIRIYNYVRMVRDIDVTSSEGNYIPSSGIMLYPNYPNPFNPTTTISFSNELNEQIELNVYNIKGKLIKNLPIPDPQSLLPNSVIWNGTDDQGDPVPSGIYFYQLCSQDYSDTKKMILMK